MTVLPGATVGQLTSVSCTSATSCEAVGYFESVVGDEAALAEGWNGAAWTLQTPLDPGTDDYLTGVSCAATACTAVGYQQDSSGHQSLAEGWDGTSWSVEPTANPATTGDYLSGVSCTAVTACTGVGYQTNSAGAAQTLAETWNGATWTAQSTPNPSPTGSSLDAVSCSSAASCVAVGFEEDAFSDLATLSELWNGISWVTHASPDANLDNQSTLEAVSCSSADACMAVGGYEEATPGQTSHDPRTLAEAWNGTSWRDVPTATFGNLDAVSCTSPGTCTAVGSTASGTTLAESWNGTSWTVESTPSLAGHAALTGVSCATATLCVAVGYADINQLVETVAEVWSGSSWSVEISPNPGVTNTLSGVSCPAVAVCVAVGSYHNGAGGGFTLAEGWNGTSWSLLGSPSPGSENDSFNGVSCASAGSCIAVGAVGQDPLAEAWNGASWTVQNPVTPSAGGSFSGVSCTSDGDCTAAGTTGNDVLAEMWSGTVWSLQSTASAYAASFSGVSCTASLTCTAVGSYQKANAPNHPLPFAEAESS
ncbi:MAG TPA: hypothetical protein VHS57_04715 [Acidimicrobiales bacterium]|nr:hypothetical protein [Acidimicrobiales bacterium]